MAQFDSLPEDVVLDVIEYLEDTDIYSLMLTNIRFHRLLHPHLYSLHIKRQHVQAFVWAVKHDDTATMRKLFDAGGDILVREIGWLATPLIVLTAACGSVAVMKLILETDGADPNLASEGNYSTAVTSAVASDKPEILKLLLAQPGLDPDRCGVHRSSALSRAAVLRREECFRLLIQDHRVNSMIRDKAETTPLMWAVRTAEDNEAILKLLLADPRVKIGAVDDDGKCALHWAAESGNVKNIRMLLDAGAGVNVNLQDDDSITPLRYARNPDVAKLLRAVVEADPSLADRDGSSSGRMPGLLSRETIALKARRRAERLRNAARADSNA